MQNMWSGFYGSNAIQAQQNTSVEMSFLYEITSQMKYVRIVWLLKIYFVDMKKKKVDTTYNYKMSLIT